jgi:hypothetical protein
MSRLCQLTILACSLGAGAAHRLRAEAVPAPKTIEVIAEQPSSVKKERTFSFPTNITVNLPAALNFANATASQYPAGGWGAQPGQLTFQQWYNSHGTGRGIWKWSNAVDAYQRHFFPYANQAVTLAEVGVQSGGSMLMWAAVMGAYSHIYGLDINPKTQAFADAQHTIVIGDQADPTMWANFFNNVVAQRGQLNMLVDDGGHEPHQMRITLVEVFNRIAPGGIVAIEDIHGLHYIDSFFVPAAMYLGHMASVGQLDSVHVYPFLLIAQKTGALPSGVQSKLQYGGSSAIVDSFQALWQAIPYHPGGHVILQNPGWGNFLTTAGITNFFKVFGALHASTWHDIPAGCEHTSQSVCTVLVTNEPMQSMIVGIHIYPTQLIVEVAGAPVTIQAVRHGTEWIEYA